MHLLLVSTQCISNLTSVETFRSLVVGNNIQGSYWLWAICAWDLCVYLKVEVKYLIWPRRWWWNVCLLPPLMGTLQKLKILMKNALFSEGLWQFYCLCRDAFAFEWMWQTIAEATQKSVMPPVLCSEQPCDVGACLLLRRLSPGMDFPLGGVTVSFSISVS